MKRIEILISGLLISQFAFATEKIQKKTAKEKPPQITFTQEDIDYFHSQNYGNQEHFIGSSLSSIKRKKDKRSLRKKVDCKCVVQ